MAPASASPASARRESEPQLVGQQVTITPLSGIPEVRPGDDVAGLLIAALESNGIAPRDQDILAVTQKIVSKAESRSVDLATVQPGESARDLAQLTRKDPRLVEVILSESAEVVRARPHVLIARTHHGLVIANAGIDQSNVDRTHQGEPVLLLPREPDRSAEQLKQRIDTHFGVNVGIVITDSAGRAWRLGTVGLAIGAAGVPSLLDRRGEPDMSGRPLEVTEVGFADSIAAAAVLAMGEAAEARPAALVRGFSWTAQARPAADLVRPKREDLFR
jgi:coenzyme F420-0:L-glutamate ligase/coenzyme F420-1:gamma-L-glutamate ligase